MRPVHGDDAFFQGGVHRRTLASGFLLRVVCSEKTQPQLQYDDFYIEGRVQVSPLYVLGFQCEARHILKAPLRIDEHNESHIVFFCCQSRGHVIVLF